MVSCKLYGRLGNQLFQVSVMIGYAIKNNMSYMLPSSTVDEKAFPFYFKNEKRLNQYDDRFRHVFNNVYKEPSHGYNEIPVSSAICLDGYFQSYKYFDFCVDYIRQAFGIGNGFTQNPFIAVHVRRGDYLLYPDKHPVVTLDYLYQGMKVFDNQPQLFMIFSDDMQWCIENFNEKFKEQFDYQHEFVPSPSSDPLYSMRIMSMASGFVISNSTFSWMPAYLCSDPNKIVVTPDESCWFGPDNKHLNVNDLLPWEWLRIKF